MTVAYKTAFNILRDFVLSALIDKEELLYRNLEIEHYKWNI